MAPHPASGGGSGGGPSSSSRSSDVDWRSRLSPFWSACCRRVAAMLDSNAWLLLIVSLTMLVLFLDDARVAVAPRHADQPVATTSTSAQRNGAERSGH